MPRKKTTVATEVKKPVGRPKKVKDGLPKPKKVKVGVRNLKKINEEIDTVKPVEIYKEPEVVCECEKKKTFIQKITDFIDKKLKSVAFYIK